MVVDGFTITGGTGNADSRSGAGIYSVGNDATTTFSNNHIVGNRVAEGEVGSTDTRGGGIYVIGDGNSSSRIIGNVIEDNVSGRGAGIASEHSTSLVIQVERGEATTAATATTAEACSSASDIRMSAQHRPGQRDWPDPEPVRVRRRRLHLRARNGREELLQHVTDNKAITVGSGIFVDNGATATFDHALVFDNRCTLEGGTAITVDSTDESDCQVTGSTFTMTRSTVTGHDCPTNNKGDGVMIGGFASRANIASSIFFANGDKQFSFGRSADLAPQVTQVFTSDPRFVDARGHDYHLAAGSPAEGFGAF